MPYIKQEDRSVIDIGPEGATAGVYAVAKNPGELNYCITQLLTAYWAREQNYQCINDIIGALEGAKMEFYRRVAVPYEDKKIQENGDIY